MASTRAMHASALPMAARSRGCSMTLGEPLVQGPRPAGSIQWLIGIDRPHRAPNGGEQSRLLRPPLNGDIHPRRWRLRKRSIDDRPGRRVVRTPHVGDNPDNRAGQGTARSGSDRQALTDGAPIRPVPIRERLAHNGDGGRTRVILIGEAPSVRSRMPCLSKYVGVAVLVNASGQLWNSVSVVLAVANRVVCHSRLKGKSIPLACVTSGWLRRCSNTAP